MIDALVVQFDRGLRAVFGPAPTARPWPAGDMPDAELDDRERRHSAALMRVNHSGEICAQALYQGQAILSQSSAVRHALESAAWEETEHLNWTERRLGELGGRKSLLNPLWFAGALAFGLLAGKLGDRWNLGFLAETERQVTWHLDDHLARLPAQDLRSRAVLEQMKADESRHATTAQRLGAAKLSLPLRLAMALASKFMTRTAYWI